MDKDTSLDSIRQKITDLDSELLKLLFERRQLSLDVARNKINNPRPVRDQQREEALLVKLVEKGRTLGLDAHYITQLYHTIIEDSVLTQQALLQQITNRVDLRPVYRVTFLGDKGSYSYQAVRQFFSRYTDQLIEQGCSSFKEIIQEVESGKADYAVLPIENTSSGSINEVYDLLQHTSLSIVGELTVPVEHCLLTAVPTSEDQIRKIYAHFQPVAQCSEFLAGLHDAEIERVDSSSSACLEVSQLKDPSIAAIGSASGGSHYGLTPLRADIANQQENFTRFIVVSRKSVEVSAQIPAKTSLIMSVAQNPGSLVEALIVLRDHQLNMSKLESRPIMGNPWEEMFYIDIEANINSDAMLSALKALKDHTRFLKVLGCYPSEEVTPTRLPDGSAKSTQPASEALSGGKTSTSWIRVRNTWLGSDKFATLVWPACSDNGADYGNCVSRLRESGADCLYFGSAGADSEQQQRERLDQLRQAANKFDLPLIADVERPDQVSELARKVDILRISGHHMQHYALLAEVGKVHRPVILTRAPMASLDELLNAAEYLMERGNRQVALCDAGTHSIEHASRRSIDLSAVAELRQRSNLPIFIDPRQATDDPALLMPLTNAVKAAGANGVLLGVNCCEEASRGDQPGHQRVISLAEFDALVKSARN